jgi:chemotaxis protein MotA
LLFDGKNVRESGAREARMNLLLSVSLMIGIGLFSAFLFKDAGLAILNPSALVIVLGGSTCALCMGFPFTKIRNTARDVLNTFRDQHEKEALVKDITKAARAYRRADIRALEREIEESKDGFLRFGLCLLLNHHEAVDIQVSMEREMAARMMRFHGSQNVLKTGARLAPAFGLVGTILMLIRMLADVHSLEALAPLMAGALMSTLYGVIIANLFMLPLAARLQDKAIASEMLLGMIVEGVLAIHNGDHPLKIEEKLNSCSVPEGARWVEHSPAVVIRSS